MRLEAAKSVSKSALLPRFPPQAGLFSAQVYDAVTMDPSDFLEVSEAPPSSAY
jgi:hypothetical protein